MSVDVLNYMLASQANQYNQYLAIAGGGQPSISVLKSGQLWYLKSTAGYPMDMNTFDNNYVYQSITNPDGPWNNPNAFKIFASPSWPGANGGIVWCPRYVTPGFTGSPIVTLNSSYRTYSNCSTFVTQNLGGPVETQYAWITQNFGGDIGQVQVLELQYRWGWTSTGYSTMEL